MQECPFPVAVELFEHWAKEGTVRTAVRAIAIGLGIIEPPDTPVRESTSPDKIADMIGNQRDGFGGCVLPLDALPEWMQLSLAKRER